MSEAPAGTGMGPDEPVGSTRSNHRSRNMIIWGGLALVLVAGVILAGVIPTGDRAGTTTSDPSPTASPTASPSASATVEATIEATVEETVEATVEATVEETVEATVEATVEETACAEGGECQVGDIGPGGGTIIYVDTKGFPCGESLRDECTTLEAGAVSYGQLCSPANNYLEAWGPDMSSGEWQSHLSRNSCLGGLLSSVRASTAGGMSDWFVGSTVEVTTAVEQATLLGIDGLDLWTSDPGSASNRAVSWRATGVWNDNYGTTGFAYVIPMRTF